MNRIIAFLTLLMIMGAYAAPSKLDLYLNQKNYKKALEYADKEIPTEERTGPVLSRIGYANEQLGMFEKAVACYTMSLQKDSDNTNALRGLSTIYKGMKNYTQAYTYSRALIQLEPTEPNLINHAWLCVDLNKPDEADPIFKRYPNNPEVRTRLINSFYNKEMYDDVLPLLHAQYKDKPSADLAWKIATSYTKTNNPEMAVYYWELAAKENNTEAILQLARTHFKLEKYSLAAQDYDRLPQPKYPLSDLYNLGVCYEKLENVNRSQAFYEAVAKSTDTAQIVTDAKIKVGMGYLLMDQYAEALKYLSTIKTDSKEMCLAKARCYEGLKDMANASNYALQYLKRDSMNVPATMIVIEYYEAQGMVTKANALRDRLLSMKTDDPVIYYDLGLYYLEKTQYDKAIKYFEKSYLLNENEITLQKISQCAFKTQNFDKAEDAAESLLQQDSGRSDAREILYKILLFKEEYTEAIKHIEYLITVYPKLDYYQDLSTCYIKTQDIERLAKIDEKIIALDKKDIPSRERYSEYLVKKKDFKTALGIFEELAMLKPKDKETKMTVAALLIDQKRYEKAIKYLKEYIQLSSNNADAYIAIGNSYYAWNKPLDAKAYYEIALRLMPTATGFYNNYAHIVLDSKTIDLAVNICEKAIRINEADYSIYTRLGDLYLKLYNYKKALEKYEQAIQKKPEDVALPPKIGTCQVKLGMNNEAILTYEQYVSMSDNIVPEMRALAGLYLEKGNKPEAIKLYKKYLKKEKDPQMALDIALYEYEKNNFNEAVLYFELAKAGTPQALFAMGHSYYEMKDLQNSIKAFEALTASYKDHRPKEAFKYLAQAYDKLPNPTQAVRYYKMYTDYAPNDSNACYRAAELQEGIHAGMAQEMYQTNTQRFPNDFRSFYRLGSGLYDRKDYKKAQVMLEKVVALNDSLLEAHVKLASIYEEQKSKEREMSEYKKILTMEPQNFYANKNMGLRLMEKGSSDAIIFLEKAHTFSNYKDADIAYGLGRVYLNINKINDALMMLNMAKALKPNDCSIRVALKDAFLKDRDINSALKESEGIILCKRSPENLTQHAYILIQLKRFAEAEKILDEVRKQDLMNFDVLLNIAQVQREQKKYNEAIETCKKISYIRDDYAPALLERAENYRALAAFERALEYYGKAQKLDSTNCLIELGIAQCMKYTGQKDLYQNHLERAQKLGADNPRVRSEYESYKKYESK
jgi:tetratricopeptide (TPR) repeat protein